jgi:FtsP/CotA-like multicopper oxidase with cupredoxin domain
MFDDASNIVPGTNPGNLGYADFLYRQDQPATTLWYHDHSLGMTRSNVYAGPAGFWLVRGGTYDGATDFVTGGPAVLPGPAPAAGQGVLALNVPGDPARSAIREIPIAIQDRSFNADGSLFYPNSRLFFDGYAGPYTGSIPTSTDIAPTWNPEAFFNTMVVNGASWPSLQVAPALYRFRLLNGCNSRFLNLSLVEVVSERVTTNKNTGVIRQKTVYGAEHPFYQIGAEQGFLPNVVRIETGFATVLPGNGTIPPLTPQADPASALLMGLAERADVIVDFRGLAAGTRIRMLNTGPDAPFNGTFLAPADPGTTGQVMEFVVNPFVQVPADATTTSPENLILNAEPANPTPPSVIREVSLNEELSGQVCVKIKPNGTIVLKLVVPPPYLNPDQIAVVCAAVGAVEMGPKAALLGTVDQTNPALPLGIPLKWTDETGLSTPTAVSMADGSIRMIPVTENPVIAGGVAPTEDWDIYNFTIDAHPIHMHLVKFEVMGRAPIPGVVPAPIPVGVNPWEMGFKDTVIAYPGEITTVRASFDIAGLYVWHCHIVEHEDNEMMRPYVVSAQ